MKVLAIVEVIFVNLVTREVKENIIFYGIFTAKSNPKKGAEILLPVGDRKSQTVFGNGKKMFSFIVEDVKNLNGKITLCLRKEEFDEVFKDEFKRNWKKKRQHSGMKEAL